MGRFLGEKEKTKLERQNDKDKGRVFGSKRGKRDTEMGRETDTVRQRDAYRQRDNGSLLRRKRGEREGGYTH